MTPSIEDLAALKYIFSPVFCTFSNNNDVFIYKNSVDGWAHLPSLDDDDNLSIGGDVSGIKGIFSGDVSGVNGVFSKNVSGIAATINSHLVNKGQLQDQTFTPSFYDVMVARYIGSPVYTSGSTGSGWRIDQLGNMTVDSLTIRKTLTVYELVIAKIRSINGGIVTSVANGIIKTVNGNNLTMTDDYTSFVVGDRVRVQSWGNGIRYYEAVVTSVTSNNIITLDSFVGTDTPLAGDELVQWGNINDTSRQNFLYQTALDGAYFAVMAGVTSDDLTGKEVMRMGTLTGITSPTWGNLPGAGVYVIGNGYFENVHVSGAITVTGGNAATMDYTTGLLTAALNALGSMAYVSAVSKAMLDDTIIEGGYIKTALINTEAIFVGGGFGDLAFLDSLTAADVGADPVGSAANIQVGGRNLLAMSNMTNGYVNGGTGEDGGYFDPYIRLITPISVTPNTYLTASFIEGTISLYQFDENDVYFGRMYLASKVPILLSSTTKYIKVEITKDGYTAIDTSYIKTNKIKLEIGNKATDWTPAPEDVQANIDMAQAAANTAQSTADSAQSAASTAQAAAQALEYLKSALTGSTDIVGGLAATNVLLLKTLAGAITGGFSGVNTDNIGMWTGGTYADALDGLAKIILNKDGSGQLAGGKMTWDTSGNIFIDGLINAIGGKFGFFNISDNVISASNISFANTGLEDITTLSNSVIEYVAVGNEAYASDFDIEAKIVYCSASVNNIVLSRASIVEFRVQYSRENIDIGSTYYQITITNSSGTVVYSNTSLSLTNDISVSLASDTYKIISFIRGRVMSDYGPITGSVETQILGKNGTGYINITPQTSITKIANNGFCSFWGIDKYLYLRTDYGFQVRFGSYGLQCTTAGLKKTTNGGSTWTSI